MKWHKRYRIFAVLLLLLATQAVQAQKVVVFTNNEYKNVVDAIINNNPKRAVLTEGKKVVFLKKKGKKRQKGRVESITDSTIVIDGKHYPPDYFGMIAFSDKGQVLRATVAPLLLATGLALIAGGSYIGYVSAKAFIEESFFLFQVPPVAFATTVVGIGTTVLGFDIGIKGGKLLPFLFLKKRYQLEDSKKWSVEIVDLSAPAATE